MAKATKQTESLANTLGLKKDIEATLAEKVLAKAGKLAGKDGAPLKPGAYDFDFTFRLSGQALVGQPSESEKDVDTMHAGLGEIIVAAFSEYPALAKIGVDELLAKGTAAIKSARRSAAGREKLEVEAKALNEAVDRAIRKAKLFSTATMVSTSAGACRVEPDVVVINSKVLERKG